MTLILTAKYIGTAGYTTTTGQWIPYDAIVYNNTTVFRFYLN